MQTFVLTALCFLVLEIFKFINSGSVPKLDKKEQRVVIKFLALQGKTTKDIHKELKDVLGDDCVSFQIVNV